MTLLEFTKERFRYSEIETNFAESNRYGISRLHRLKDIITEDQYTEILENFKEYHYMVVPLNPRIFTQMVCEEDEKMVFYEFGKNRNMYFSYKFDLHSPIFKMSNYGYEVCIKDISINKGKIDFNANFGSVLLTDVVYEEISLYTEQDYLYKLFEELNNLGEGKKMTFEEYEFIRKEEWIKYRKINSKGGNREWE